MGLAEGNFHGKRGRAARPRFGIEGRGQRGTHLAGPARVHVPSRRKRDPVHGWPTLVDLKA